MKEDEVKEEQRWGRRRRKKGKGEQKKYVGEKKKKKQKCKKGEWERDKLVEKGCIVLESKSCPWLALLIARQKQLFVSLVKYNKQIYQYSQQQQNKNKDRNRNRKKKENKTSLPLQICFTKN